MVNNSGLQIQEQPQATLQAIRPVLDQIDSKIEGLVATVKEKQV